MYKDGVSIVTSLDKLKIIPLSINLINTVAEGRVIPEKCLVVDSRHFEQLWGIAWNRLESLGIAWNRLESLGITWNWMDKLVSWLICFFHTLLLARQLFQFFPRVNGRSPKRGSDGVLM